MIINNITFNFLDKYYPFYEWLLDDELVTKKCYVYKVSSNILNDLISQLNYFFQQLYQHTLTSSYPYLLNE